MKEIQKTHNPPLCDMKLIVSDNFTLSSFWIRSTQKKCNYLKPMSQFIMNAQSILSFLCVQFHQILSRTDPNLNSNKRILNSIIKQIGHIPCLRACWWSKKKNILKFSVIGIKFISTFKSRFKSVQCSLFNSKKNLMPLFERNLTFIRSIHTCTFFLKVRKKFGMSIHGKPQATHIIVKYLKAL